MQAVLQIGWIVGEANKRDLTFTDTQVNQSLQQIKSQFKTEAEYVKARDQAGLTEADVLARAKLQLIQNKIQDDINNSVGTPSTSDAKDYYDANKQQFTQPAKRTIRIIQNKDPHQIDLAYQALRTDQPPPTGRRWRPSTRRIRPRRRRAGCAPMSCPAPSSSPSTAKSSRRSRVSSRARCRPPPATSSSRSSRRPPRR